MTDQSTGWIVLRAIFFLPALGQAISGFGFALVGMPLTTMIMGAQASAPLVALAGWTLYTINLLRYHASINWQQVVRRGIAAAVGVPMGIWGLVNLNGSFKTFLGCILIGYALYSFARPTTPFSLSPRWVTWLDSPPGVLAPIPFPDRR